MIGLAWRYLWTHRWGVGVVVIALALLVIMPVGLQLVVERTTTRLTARAAAMPLVVGAAGSDLDLTLATCYGSRRPLTPLPWSAMAEIRQHGGRTAAPIVLGPTVAATTLFGTDRAYLRAQQLEIVSGAPFRRIGEVVLGAAVAKRLAVRPGTSLPVDVASVVDLVAEQGRPVRVVGILAPTGGPDDDLILTDVRTVWFLQGFLHDHDEPTEATALQTRADGTVVASAQVVMAETASQALHRHGPVEDLPLTGVVVWPEDRRSAALLTAALRRVDPPLLVVDTQACISEVLATVAAVAGIVRAVVLGIAGAALVLIGLVLILALWQRRAEFTLLGQLGASRRFMAGQVVIELAVCCGLALLIAGAVLSQAPWWADLIWARWSA